MNTVADYEVLYLILMLLPLVTASIVWLLDRFNLIPDASAEARFRSLELLMHKEISERTEICNQLGMAVKQIVEFLKRGNVEIRPSSPTDIKQQNAESDSAEKEVRSAPPKKPAKTNNIKNKRGGKKRGVPRGNVTPFPHSNVQKSRNSEDNTNV